MKRAAAIVLIAELCLALTASAKTFEWRITSPQAHAETFTAYHGETVRFNPVWSGALSNVTSSVLYYQTNGMDRTWWQADGLTFAPSNDVGAASYRFFIRATDPEGVNYTANGLLRLMESPGFVPNTITPPVAALDFDSIDVSNAPYYTKAETDAKIVELAPTPDLSGYATTQSLMAEVSSASQSATNYTDNVATTLRGEIAAAQPADYATVSNKAMTALQSYTETDPTVYSWAKASSKPTYTLNEVAPNSENWLGVQGNAGRTIKILAQGSGSSPAGGVQVTASTLNNNNTTTYAYSGVAVKRNGANTDYLWDTTSSSGIVRRSELDDKADAGDLATLSASVTSIAGMLNAENARFVSTNYNSNAHIPEAYVEAKIDGSWLTIWSEMTRWNWLTSDYLPDTFHTKSQIASLLDDKADRAWGFYDSHSGLYAPEGFTWVSSPKIAIAGGLAYSRTVTAEGAVWVLEANGMVAETGGLTNGFFRVSDDEGNALFEIVKGDKRTVGAQANSVQVIGAFVPSKLQIGYAVQAETHPTLQITASLTDPDWYDEDSASCPANVTWSGVSGAYVATVQAKSASATQLFVKAEYQVGGETYIKNVGPISVDGGIYCTDNIHRVRPVYNNGSITWEVVQ